MPPHRLVPLIVAVALFMENMDSTVIATSLPAIAADLGTSPLALKLAMTSYLLSLAIFIPASGWTADRFGARNVFAGAIAVFILGSIGCAFANSLEGFVVARVVQGMGGAMMTPVGRLVVVRTIDKRDFVNAMAWLTTPALIGPVVGPPLGGFITTYASWHWIFIINVPIGLVGVFLVMRYIDPVREQHVEPFDGVGLLLAGLGVAGLAFGLSVAGLDLWPWWWVTALVAGGAVFMAAYLLHARRVKVPVLDFSLFRIATFRASVVGGFLFRVGIGALPFLLPLMLQTGFGLNPFQSGLVTFAAAVGAIGMKFFAGPLLKRFGFRTILVSNALIAAMFLLACAFFTPATPMAVIVTLLLIGGFFRSLQFTAANTLAYADIETRAMSRATAMASVAQQLSLAAGVAIGAFAVEMTLRWTGSTEITASDFAPAFVVVSVISALSVVIFARMPANAGAELSGRTAPVPQDSSDNRMG